MKKILAIALMLGFGVVALHADDAAAPAAGAPAAAAAPAKPAKVKHA
jgi:hypothetical protein